MNSQGRVPGDLRRIPPRARDSHKGDFGRVLVIGGSYGMHGAPALSAAAALHSGAGLVTLGVPRAVYPIVGCVEWRATFLPLPQTAAGGLSRALSKSWVST